MKKYIYYSILSIIAFSACQKDMTVSEGPASFEWPKGTSEYAPYTIGSSFVYEFISGNPSVTDSFLLIVTKDTIINNLKFYKLESSKPALSPSYFVNDNNGIITEITYNLNFLGLITVPELIENTLRTNVEANSTWNDNDLNLTYLGFPVNVKFMHTLMHKNYTKEVLNKNYEGCFSAKEIVNIFLPAGVPFPTGVPSTIQYDNCYAKGVGLAQRVTSTGTSQKIKRFYIVK
jgi:hypothetical protein